MKIHPRPDKTGIHRSLPLILGSRNNEENTLEVGISPGLNIIYGNINEPLSAIDDAVEFLLKYDDHAQMRTIRPVTPYPGSELFDYAINKCLAQLQSTFPRTHQ